MPDAYAMPSAWTSVVREFMSTSVFVAGSRVRGIREGVDSDNDCRAPSRESCGKGAIVLTIQFFSSTMVALQSRAVVTAVPVHVIEEAGRAASVLHPLRLRILGELGEAESAAELARRLG